MASKPAHRERDRRLGGSFATNEPAGPKPDLGQSPAKDLRDLAFIALELLDVPVEQKLAEIEYKVALQRLTFRRRLSETIDLVYPWLILSTYALLALRMSAGQERQRRTSADLEEPAQPRGSHWRLYGG
jgi:hypothetical protein